MDSFEEGEYMVIKAEVPGMSTDVFSSLLRAILLR